MLESCTIVKLQIFWPLPLKHYLKFVLIFPMMLLYLQFPLQALQVADRLEAGTCFVNTYNKTDVAAPFGGFKQSGFGKDLGKNYIYHIGFNMSDSTEVALYMHCLYVQVVFK